MNIKLLVITYDSSLEFSETLKSIGGTNLQNINLNLIIWNNGPKFFRKDDVDLYLNKCNSLGISVKIFQDIRNVSLSMIYNKFSVENDYDFISIFDQDSVIPYDFFQNMIEYCENDLILPIINTDGLEIKSRYPCFTTGDKKNKVIDLGSVSEKITSITSGICISRNLCDSMISYRGFLFDESLAFYGIDVEFFLGLNSLMKSNKKIKVYCAGYIMHSLSCDDENERMSPFRMIELFYFQIYYRRKKQGKNELSNFWIYIREIMRGKIKANYIFPAMYFMFNNRHPRTVIKISADIEPTDQCP